MLTQRFDAFKVPFPHPLKLLRVDADGGVDMGVCFRERDGLLAAQDIAAGIDDQLHPGLRQGGQQRVPIGVEGLVIIVGMGIEIHGVHSFIAHILQ